MYRIKKYEDGYVVEVNRRQWTFLGLKDNWCTHIFFKKIKDIPYYYETYEEAFNAAVEVFKDELSNF